MSRSTITLVCIYLILLRLLILSPLFTFLVPMRSSPFRGPGSPTASLESANREDGASGSKKISAHHPQDDSSQSSPTRGVAVPPSTTTTMHGKCGRLTLRTLPRKMVLPVLRIPKQPLTTKTTELPSESPTTSSAAPLSCADHRTETAQREGSVLAMPEADPILSTTEDILPPVTKSPSLHPSRTSRVRVMSCSRPLPASCTEEPLHPSPPLVKMGTSESATVGGGAPAATSDSTVSSRFLCYRQRAPLPDFRRKYNLHALRSRPLVARARKSSPASPPRPSVGSSAVRPVVPQCRYTMARPAGALAGPSQKQVPPRTVDSEVFEQRPPPPTGRTEMASESPDALHTIANQLMTSTSIVGSPCGCGPASQSTLSARRTSGFANTGRQSTLVTADTGGSQLRLWPSKSATPRQPRCIVVPSADSKEGVRWAGIASCPLHPLVTREQSKACAATQLTSPSPEGGGIGTPMFESLESCQPSPSKSTVSVGERECSGSRSATTTTAAEVTGSHHWIEVGHGGSHSGTPCSRLSNPPCLPQWRNKYAENPSRCKLDESMVRQQLFEWLSFNTLTSPTTEERVFGSKGATYSRMASCEPSGQPLPHMPIPQALATFACACSATQGRENAKSGTGPATDDHWSTSNRSCAGSPPVSSINKPPGNTPASEEGSHVAFAPLPEFGDYAPRTAQYRSIMAAPVHRAEANWAFVDTLTHSAVVSRSSSAARPRPTGRTSLSVLSQGPSRFLRDLTLATPAGCPLAEHRRHVTILSSETEVPTSVACRSNNSSSLASAVAPLPEPSMTNSLPAQELPMHIAPRAAVPNHSFSLQSNRQPGDDLSESSTHSNSIISFGMGLSTMHHSAAAMRWARRTG